jgi:hypothetical protein
VVNKTQIHPIIAQGVVVFLFCNFGQMENSPGSSLHLISADVRHIIRHEYASLDSKLPSYMELLSRHVWVTLISAINGLGMVQTNAGISMEHLKNISLERGGCVDSHFYYLLS